LAYASAALQRAGELGERAEDEKDYRTAAMALREYRSAADAYAKLRADMPQHVDLARSPEFIDFRDTIFAALEPFPEALDAVMRALAAGG
jgi:hypothetical protein